MQTQTDEFPRLLMWIAGIAFILFYAVGTADFMEWIPSSVGGPNQADNIWPLGSGYDSAAHEPFGKTLAASQNVRATGQ